MAEAHGTVRGGIDLGGTKIQAVVVDAGHTVIGQARRPTPTTGGPADVVAALIEAVTEAARRAKLQVSRAGRHIGQEAIQLHGGIGMTAEYAVGHYTSRLTTIDHLLGDGREQTAHLAEHLGDYEIVQPLR